MMRSAFNTDGGRRRMSKIQCWSTWARLLLLTIILVNNVGEIVAVADASSSDETIAPSQQRRQDASIFPPVPLIDLSSWSSYDKNKNSGDDNSLTNEQQQVVDKIHQACQTVGFFLIANHGVPVEDMNAAWTASRSFFDLPLSEKLRYHSTNTTEYPYGFEQSEQLVKGKELDGDSDSSSDDDDADMAVNVADLKETFAIGPNDKDSGMPLRRWIDQNGKPQLATDLETYYTRMEELADTLLHIFALALDQQVDYFEDKMDHHMSALRLINYYPLEIPKYKSDIVRAGAHSDYGALTILNAQKEGLQVQRSRWERQAAGSSGHRKVTEWYSVPVHPGALVINLGDLMQRWTNDKWVSTMHRVVMPSTDAKERRYSMAYFVNINGDAMVEALDSCYQTDGTEKRYPSISARDHLMAKHLASMGAEEDDRDDSSLSDVAKEEL